MKKPSAVGKKFKTTCRMLIKSTYKGIKHTLCYGVVLMHHNEAIDTVIAEVEKHLPTDEKTVCPECLKKCTNEELRMFGGLCEECSTDFN